ncbi:EAL domain-containing protein [Arthrobacter sp. MDB2-24]
MTEPDDRWSEHLAAACRGEGIVSMYQPIVDTARGTIVGFEALLRFPGFAEQDPEVWFARSRRAGCPAELEAAALRSALAHRPSLPRNCFLTVNVSPDLLPAPAIRDVWDETGHLGGVIIELTEHAEIESYLELEPDLNRLKAAGALIAVDDAGSGYAGLQHLLALRPAFVKVDRDFITDIHHDEAKRALVDMLGAFVGRLDAWIIAEGVERIEELDVLASLGVPLVQGYLLGRPALPWGELDPEIAHRLARRVPARRPSVGSVLEVAATVTSIDDARAAFAGDPSLTEVVLVSGRRPVAVLTQDAALLGVLGQGMCVNTDTPIPEALERCVTRDVPTRFDPALATDDAGNFAGLVRVERLITALTRSATPVSS